MSGRGRCNACGAINREDAAFCTQCFTRNPLMETQSASATPVVAGGFSPAPALATAAVAGYPFVEPVEPIAPARSSSSSHEPLRWRWKHLSMFYAAVWILPSVLDLFLSDGVGMSSFEIGRASC